MLENGWQSIDTAPLDGSWILAGSWCGPLPHLEWHSQVCAFREDYFSKQKAWGGSPGWFFGKNAQPTHWMPLPKPPLPAKACEAEERAYAEAMAELSCIG